MTKMLLSALVLSLSYSAFAQEQNAAPAAEGETKMKIEEAADKKNTVDGDIDQEITNKKLRAESGSKSKWSLTVNTNYTGGSVEKPFAARRPDLYGLAGTQKVSSLSIGPNVRYRWSKNDSITAGTQIGLATPLQGHINSKNRRTGQKVDQYRWEDPNVGYSRVGKIGGVQSIIGAGVTYGSSPESLSTDKLTNISLAWTLMKTFQNGLSLGIIAAADGTIYTSAAGRAPQQVTGYGKDDRDDYGIGFYAMGEYELTDKLSVRTVARYTNWYHMYGDPQSARLLHVPGTQSLGLGYSFTRDIYVYPNVQFDWADLEGDRTNVALSAIVNVF